MSRIDEMYERALKALDQPKPLAIWKTPKRITARGGWKCTVGKQRLEKDLSDEFDGLTKNQTWVLKAVHLNPEYCFKNAERKVCMDLQERGLLRNKDAYGDGSGNYYEFTEQGRKFFNECLKERK